MRLQATTGNASAVRRLRVHDPHKNFCVGVELIESLSKAFPLLCSPFLGQFVSKPIIATTLTSKQKIQKHSEEIPKLDHPAGRLSSPDYTELFNHGKQSLT